MAPVITPPVLLSKAPVVVVAPVKPGPVAVPVVSPHGTATGTVLTANGTTYAVQTSTSFFSLGGQVYNDGPFTLKIAGTVHFQNGVITTTGSLTATLYNGTTQVGQATFQAGYFYPVVHGSSVTMTF